MANLPNDTESPKVIIKRLLEKIAQLEAENAELRRRLGLDSTNSHKPPSSDGYKKKTTKPGIPKDEKRSNGGQKGHKGKTLERVANPDHVEIHLPDQCQCCGRQFNEGDAHEVIQSRQVFDLPVPKLEVTEHQIAQIECCGIVQRGKYPPDVTVPAQYGAGVKAFVSNLSVAHKMPLEQICQLFKDMYGYDLNSSTVLGALDLGHELIEPIEGQIIEDLLKQDVVNFDETGIRVKGKLYWLHTASTESQTHLFVHEKRGAEALKSVASPLKDFKGKTVHDCWKPYFTFKDTSHFLCGAHLLRELDGLIENGSSWAEKMRALLLELYKTPRPILIGEEAIRSRYRAILTQADQEEPPPQRGKRGKPKQSRGRNLFDRLKGHENGALGFAFEVGVPFTNNQAERDLRGAKVKQKVSGCFRTEQGARIYARLQAAISTFRKQGLNVFATLRDLFARRPVVVM
jgi:transposase